MTTRLRMILLLMATALLMAACGGSSDEQESASVPTATMQPLVTLTPRPTATPFITRTPLPTFTPIPSDTLTPSRTPIPPTPTATPPVTGIVGGDRRINFRAGPGRDEEVIGGLTPGTGLLILGQNSEGTWLNVERDDGTQGWVSAGLIFIEPTRTPVPTATPTIDETALALGTPLPTAVMGGGTVTPTPPRAAVSATPVGTPAEETTEEVDPEPTEPFLPVVDDAINATATALAGGIVEISPPAREPLTPAATGQSPNVNVTRQPTATSGGPTLTAPPVSDDSQVKQNERVFAMCDDSALGGEPPPNDLAPGSTIIVYWGWIVAEPRYMEQHLENVNYEVRVNGDRLTNWRSYDTEIQQTGSSYAKFWYVPYSEPLEAGTVRITYRATWDEQITDGYESFGPGTRNAVEEGTCTFSVG